MGGDDFEVVGRVVISDEGAAALGTVNSQLDGMSSKTNLLKSVTSAFGDVARFVWANVVLSAVMQATTAIGNFISGVIKGAGELQNINNQLSAVIQSSGRDMATTTQMVDNITKAMEKTTIFTDEAGKAAATVLLQFHNIGDQIFGPAMQAAADLAARKQIDLATAAQLVGRALAEPSIGVGRLNMQYGLFDKTQLKMIQDMTKSGNIAGAQKMILDALNNSVGGASAAAADTFEGAWTRVKNILQSTFEEALQPTMKAMGDFLDEMIVSPQFDSFVTFLGNIPSIFFGLYQSIQQVGGGNVIGSLINNLLKGLGSLNIGQGIGTLLSNINWKDISDQFAAGMNKIDWAGVGNSLVQNLRAMNIDGHLKDMITQTDWGAVFGSIGSAFMNFATGLAGGDFDQFKAVWAGDWQLFVQIVQEAWAIVVSKVQSAVNGVANTIKSGVGNIVAGIKSWNAGAEIALNETVQMFFQKGQAAIVNVGKGALGAVQGAIAAVRQALDAIKAAVGAGISIPISFAVGSLGGILARLGIGGGGGGSSTGGGGSVIHARAGGGDVLAGIGYMVGETGPEPFIPAVGGSIISNSNWLKMVSALSDFTGSMRNSGLVASGAFGSTSSGSVIHNYYGNVSFNLGTSDVNSLVQSLRRTG